MKPARLPSAARRTAGLAAIAVLLTPLTATAQARIDAATLASMHTRSIGPAGMSGRVTAIDVVVDQPDTMFIGAATGGVWRSDNGGVTWTPIFDAEPVQSIGAIAINQQNPAIVWVGTGEGNPRNSAGVGDGVYRSLDGGRTWTHLGLGKSERIHRIVLDPRDPDVAYVGVMGPEWSDGEQRGVYKTTDGGRTWARILFTNQSSGVSDLVMDPANPNKLFAAMWDFRRWPWFFRSGGPGSGLFVSYDAGASWTRLGAADGLPAGDLGRIGVAIAAHDPDVVTAVVEAKESALVRSYDGGRTWTALSRDRRVIGRPFYFADIRVDPTDASRIYSVNSQLYASDDEGRTWRLVVPSAKVHGDVQYVWLSPRGGLMLQGSDGGVAISRDDGRTWRWVENLPVGQFYHVDVDDAVPFNVYGGMQDNGSWLGPSSTWTDTGIRNAEWTRVGGGDGMRVLDDPTDEASGYAMSQTAYVFRFDRRTGEHKDIRPVSPDTAVPLRFNWNAALAIDPFDPGTIYLGSQYLHRSADRGDSWEVISPDLTTNDPAKQRQAKSGGLTIDDSGAENHTTIMSIAPSPAERGVIWVGTDDGNVQLTRDGGAHWSNVVGNIRGVPKATWVSHVEASPHATATAFVTLDNHRRGDWTTYVFRTDDYGRSWTRLAASDVRGFAHTIAQDPAEPRLLFLGTEFGLWVSLDAGHSWFRWSNGLPAVPVRGLAIQSRDGDLAIGTHGRAAWILDDIRPLRELARDPALLERGVHLFEPPHAWVHDVAEAPGYRSTGDALYEGENRPYGALITYALADSAGPAQVEILHGGDVIRTLEAPAGAGVHRVVWDLRYDAVRTASGRPYAPEAVPDRYAVRVRAGDAVSGTRPLELLADPRVRITIAERQAKLDAELALLHQGIEPALDARRRLTEARRSLERVEELLREKAEEPAPTLAREASRLRRSLAAADSALDGPLDDAGAAFASLQSSFDSPTVTQRARARRVRQRLEPAVRQARQLLERDLADYSRRLAGAGISLLPEGP